MGITYVGHVNEDGLRMSPADFLQGWWLPVEFQWYPWIKIEQPGWDYRLEQNSCTMPSLLHLGILMISMGKGIFVWNKHTILTYSLLSNTDCAHCCRKYANTFIASFSRHNSIDWSHPLWCTGIILDFFFFFFLLVWDSFVESVRTEPHIWFRCSLWCIHQQINLITKRRMGVGHNSRQRHIIHQVGSGSVTGPPERCWVSKLCACVIGFCNSLSLEL